MNLEQFNNDVPEPVVDFARYENHSATITFTDSDGTVENIALTDADVISEEDDRFNPSDGRLQFGGINEDGQEVLIYRDEFQDNLVVDEITVDGNRLYKRPTFH